MDLIDAIKKRRSIRQFKSDPVKDEDIIKILDAARLAPSWHNCQCWKFVVVKDAGIKEALAGTPAAGNRGSEAIRQAPVVIVACAELGKSGYIRGELVSDKGEWFMFDVALAIQNLCLTATSLGLGTLNIGWFDANKAAGIINVPDGVVVIELIPLGYPDVDPKPTSRQELSEIVFYNKYGVKKL